MAYNSDGYIMIDFTEVDFRRTNQTIEGLYKRCVDVIGTNKFILVINANGRTPLPATCSFTNNQYVIDTCIYMFAISSNDNLFIRRNDVPASDIIDDSSISVDKTWSSNKIDSELDTKADSSALADYQPLLTAGTNITIDENNEISADVRAVIDDNHITLRTTWSSYLISALIEQVSIKSFTYVGNDNVVNTISFPKTPRLVFIQGNSTNSTAQSGNILYGISKGTTYESISFGSPGTSLSAARSIDITYDGNDMTLTGGSSARALNSSGVTYTVYYI